MVGLFEFSPGREQIFQASPFTHYLFGLWSIPEAVLEHLFF